MRKPRIIAWLAGSIGLLAVLATLLVFLLPYVVESQAIERRVRALLAEKVGASVNFEKIEFTWLPWPAVSVRRLSFSMADDVKGTAENIEVYPSIYGLLTGRLLISRLNARRLAIAAKIPERRVAPFGIQEVEEKIRAGLKTFTASFPGIRARITDGLAEIRSGDGQPFVLRETDVWIRESASNLEFSLFAQSNISRDIRFTGKIAGGSLATEAQISIERLGLRDLGAMFLSDKSYPIEAGSLDLDLRLSALGFQSFEAEVRGALPSLTLARAGGRATIEGKRFQGTVKGDERSIRGVANRIELLSPRAEISAEVLLDRSSSLAKLTLAGRNGDAEEIRDLAMRVAGTSAPVQEIFRYLRGGRIPEVRIETEGGSLDQLAALRNLVVAARLREGRVFIPTLDLNLVDVNGSVALAGGVLVSQGLAARHGGSRAWEGKLRLQLDHTDGAALQLEMMVESEAREAHDLLRRAIKDETYLKEASRVRNLEGRIAGRLVLNGPVDSLVPSIFISKANLKALYEPVPFPISVRGGRFSYADRAIQINDLDGTLGRSSLSGFSGSLNMDGPRRFLVDSASLSLDVEQTLGLLRRSADLSLRLNHVKSAKGRLEVGSFSLSGPLSDPGLWEFRGAGQIDGLVVDHGDLPGPITLTEGRFDATARRFAFSDVRASLSDASVTAGGVVENPINGRPRLDALASGSIGRQMAQWLRLMGELPEKLATRSPLEFTDARLRWSGEGESSVRGRIGVAGGPRVFLDAARSGERISVREFTVESGLQRARMALELAKDRLELSFAGALDQKTLREVFSNPPIESGRIEGDIKASYFFNPPFRFSAAGRLEGKNLRLALGDAPVIVDEFFLEGGGEKLLLRSADLRWRGGRFLLSGRVTALKDGMKLDVDARADRVVWEDVGAIAAGRGVGGGKILGAGVSLPRLEWDLRLNAEEFTFERYSSRPLHVGLALSPGGMIVGKVERSVVCGIEATGNFEVKDETVGLALQLSVTDGELEPTSRCLTNEQIQGTYSLKADLKGAGDAKNLLQSLKGDVELIARDGGFIRSSGVDAAFDYLNSTGDFDVEFPDLDKETFPYRLLSVKGSLDGSIFKADEVIVQSTTLTVTGEGTVDIERNEVDVKGLVFVGAPGSRVLRKVPIVGSVLGGSLVGIPMRVSGPLDNPEASYLSPTDVGAELLNMPLRILGLPLEALEIFKPGSDKTK